MSTVLKRIASTFVVPAGAPPGFLLPDESDTLPFLSPTEQEPVPFVSPAEEPDRGGAAPAPPIDCLAVVCSGRDLAVAGAAVGLGLLETVRVRCAVVVEWTGSDRPAAIPRPAGRSARRCAAALVGRGLMAVAGGRVVRVALPADEGEAVRLARHALATGGGPVVLAIGGPRTAGFDELIAEQRATLLATPHDGDQDLADLAAVELRDLGPAVERLVLPDAPVAAGFARAGVALVAPLRAAVLRCLETGR